METRAAISSSLLSRIQAEADLLASIRHPYVVSFIGLRGEPLSVVTEYCARGSLFTLLNRAKADAAKAAELTWARRLGMAANAAAGMLHLHQRSSPILHRDMKSANVLVDQHWQGKVADLGLSRVVEAVVEATSAGSTAANMNPRWLAREVLEGDWTAASDVYSFGVVLWEMLTWELPWSHLKNIYMVSCLITRLHDWNIIRSIKQKVLANDIILSQNRSFADWASNIERGEAPTARPQDTAGASAKVFRHIGQVHQADASVHGPRRRKQTGLCGSECKAQRACGGGGGCGMSFQHP